MILASVGKMHLSRNAHRLNSGYAACSRLLKSLALFGPLYIRRPLSEESV
jgi:hypothetical protein